MRWWPALGGALMVAGAMPAAAVSVASDDAGSIYRVPVDGTGRVVEDCTRLAIRHAALCGGGGATDADILFVNADRTLSMPASSFSLLAAGGAPMRASAYDAAGRLLGVAESGDRIELSGIGQIARIAVRPAATDGPASIKVADRLSHLPEPATWAMLIAGFALIAMAIRRVIRRSEARFDARIRRMTTGEAA